MCCSIDKLTSQSREITHLVMRSSSQLKSDSLAIVVTVSLFYFAINSIRYRLLLVSSDLKD